MEMLILLIYKGSSGSGTVDVPKFIFTKLLHSLVEKFRFLAHMGHAKRYDLVDAYQTGAQIE